RTGGTVTLNSTVTQTAQSTTSGIQLASNSNSSTISFNNTVTLGTTGSRFTTAPLTLSANGSAPINFTKTAGGSGLNLATGGSTAGIVLSGNTFGAIAI